MTERPVVIVGLMGAGKTSVATRVASALGRQLHDSDEDLQEWYGRNAAEHAERFGAGVLHTREADQLRAALAQDAVPVIAAAASVVEDGAIRQALVEPFVVWLDAPPPVLAERMRGGDHRPHFEPDLEKMLTRQRERRSGWFAEVADLVIDVSRVGPDEAAATILSALGQ
jgi:shikimate kinase